MRQVTLSDFVGGRIREAQRERANRFEFERRAYELGAPARKGKLIALFSVVVPMVVIALMIDPTLGLGEDFGDWVGTWEEHRRLMIHPILAGAALLLLVIVPIGIYSGSPPPKMSEPSDQEEIWRAGEIGEQQTADAFGRVLDDNWVLLKGYKNSKGEIDQIFVGPGGVTAVEIKNYNGAIHIDGDSWTRHRRIVSADNAAETVVEPIQDAGGRAPSRQLNEPASQLQKFLSERSNVKRINRAVVLTHDKSEIGPIFSLTVDYVVTLNDIRRRDHHVFVFGDGRVSLDRESVDRISSLIRQDHDFHNKSDDK